ncbi:MAG TPA: NDP-sugar synthase, partial [Candidatus Binatia bacterium]|nr:NDP-sugar synthase [Candidatus Binatia bacterium]
MKFFILAGGYGKRAAPLSLIKAKAVFPLNGIPLLSLLLQQVRDRHGLHGFINPHHLGDQVVQTAGPARGIDFIYEKELSGSLVLRQALPFFSEWLLVINGDTFLEIPLAELLEKASAPEVDGALLVRADPSGNYACLRCEGDRFADVSLPGSSPGIMYAGVALFKKNAVEKIDDVNFFNTIRRRRLHFKTVAYDGIWLDSGTPGSYLLANHAYRAHLAAAPGNALSENVVISPLARVERSVLWENTRLGDRVALSECIVSGDME